MDFDELYKSLTDLGVNAGGKLLAALLLWIGGRLLISFAKRVLNRALKSRNVDATIGRYANSALSVILNVTLVVAILGYFGVQTTTFAAVLAAAGVAIGMAWSGLLANFAAGAFLIILRPIKTGDFITAAGITGTVREIGLFTTVIDTLDNVKTIVGNNKLFAGNIQNYTANPYRRVDLLAQLNHGVDHREAIELLKKRLAGIANVLEDPAPEVDILEFNLAGPVLAVRPFCNNDDYWQVYFDTNEAIREEFGKAGFPVPETHYNISKAA